MQVKQWSTHIESSEPVVQVIWPMVNMRPFGVAMEPGMMTILFI